MQRAHFSVNWQGERVIIVPTDRYAKTYNTIPVELRRPEHMSGTAKHVELILTLHAGNLDTIKQIAAAIKTVIAQESGKRNGAANFWAAMLDLCRAAYQAASAKVSA